MTSLGCAGVLLVLVFIGLFVSHRVRQYRLLSARTDEGWDYVAFRKALGEDISSGTAQKIYSFFQDRSPANIPVKPTDRLDKIHGMVGSDVYDEMKDLARVCGGREPDEREAYQVETVSDAALLMELLRRDRIVGE